MSTTSPTNLEAAIRDAGEDWLIDLYAPPEQAIPHIVDVLGRIQEAASSRFGDNAPDFSESGILGEYRRNPLKMKGFFQILGGSRSADMLLLAWRIIQGVSVSDVNMNHVQRQSFRLEVRLDDASDRPYVTQNIHDFALFRHIGTAEINGAPVFDGFYALRLQR